MTTLPTLKVATITPPKSGRIAEPNPWVDVLKNLPANPELEGWSVAQGFVCPTADAKGHVAKIRAAGGILHIGVAVQVEDNAPSDSAEVIKTEDKFTVKVGFSLVRFATRPKVARKPRAVAASTNAEPTVEAGDVPSA